MAPKTQTPPTPISDPEPQPTSPSPTSQAPATDLLSPPSSPAPGSEEESASSKPERAAIVVESAPPPPPRAPSAPASAPIEEPPQPTPITEPIEQIDPEVVVKALLVGQGWATHQWLKGAPGQWLWTDDELDQIAPPLARMAARSRVGRAMVAAGDPIAVAMVAFNYGLRNTIFQGVDPRALIETVNPGQEGKHENAGSDRSAAQRPEPDAGEVDRTVSPFASQRPPG